MIYLKRGKTIELHGGGKAIKSFIYIRELVRRVILTIEHGSSETYHFTVPSDETVADIVRQICKWMGFGFESVTATVAERLGQDAHYWLDFSKARSQLGWFLEVQFEQGVGEVIVWVENNWNEILHETPLLSTN